MTGSEFDLQVQKPLMNASNPEHLADYHEGAVVDDDDFGNFIDEESMEKEANDQVEDEDEDEEEDDDSVSSLAKIKKSSSFATTGMHIPRNQSFVSFLTRSERSHLMGKDKPPSLIESSKRKIRFHDNLETVHTVELVPDNEKKHYWTNHVDFDRFENEIKLTKFRWENHKSGRIKFDEISSSIRGLEHMIKDGPTSKAGYGLTPTWKHSRKVLEEIHRQKTEEKKSNDSIDWEKVREASVKSSAPGYQHALDMGLADEVARDEAWDESSATKKKPDSPNSKPRKKSWESRLMFWKK
jgi:hypothetical protein